MRRRVRRRGAAGALDEETGARLACRRAGLLRAVAGRGAMAVVPADFATVARRLAEHGRDERPGVVPAVDASPYATVVSGPADQVAEAVRRWEREGLRVRPVACDAALHSPAVDGLRARILTAFGEVAAKPPAVPLYSTATADPGTRPRATPPTGPRRRAARSASPRPYGRRWRTATRCSWSCRRTRSRRRSSRGPSTTRASPAAGWRTPAPPPRRAAHAAGEPRGPALPRRTGRLGGPVPGARRRDAAALPTQAWQHRRYWARSPEPPPGTGPGHDPADHTLLGDHSVVHGTSRTDLWQTRLSDANRPSPATTRCAAPGPGLGPGPSRPPSCCTPSSARPLPGRFAPARSAPARSAPGRLGRRAAGGLARRGAGLGRARTSAWPTRTGWCGSPPARWGRVRASG
ncbi:acyltransferase domain-containing protein [Streptomyces sp. M19]